MQKTQDGYFKQTLQKQLPLLAGFLLIAGGSSHAQQNPNEAVPEAQRNSDVIIKVYFNEEGCPVKVDQPEPELQASKGTKVQWRAYKGTEDEAYFDEDINFSVYFDPFVDGKTIRSHKGVATSSPLNRNAPRQFENEEAVSYKYSVLSAEARCIPKPLDPRLRIRD